MSYIKDDFLLSGETAKKLYYTYAKDMPIFDYHCHLSEKQILENKPFEDIYEIWLAGDHYKWRLMRNYGVSEDYITGDKSRKEKFAAYCRALGTAFGNPLYHWSQVELKEFFGCETEINELNAESIWNECNEYIRTHKVTPQMLIEQSNVSHVFTTNEIFDDLTVYEEIAQKNYAFKVFPSYRADKIMNIESDIYCEYISKLGEIKNLSALETALELRLQDFLRVNSKVSDISLQHICKICDRERVEKIFEQRLKGKKVDTNDVEDFKGYLTYFLMKLFSKYGICVEIHIGPMRNNNTKMFERLGADTGYDSIAQDDSIKNLSDLFDRLDKEESLPKTVVFNLNPKMNTEIMTLIGCFQSAEVRGKIQYGPAWWFLDNKVGIRKHFEDLTATGHIGAFIGMLTDSRSFLSYPRHHYFRRILCSYFGEMMDNGEMTLNQELVGKVIKDICYNNAIEYFGGK